MSDLENKPDVTTGSATGFPGVKPAEPKPALDPVFQEKPNPAARPEFKPFEENVILPSPVVGSPPNTVDAEKQREADRRAKAAEANTGSNPPVTGTQTVNPVIDPKPPAGSIEKPIVGPAPTTGKPEVLSPVVKDEPIVHGEGAQRFANRNAIHSERVLHGKTVTMPVRKERYEHPERRHDDR